MRHLRAELERVRQELLDLSLRNPLLNFRAHRRSTVEVEGEVPREVYRRLVLQGRTMAFTPREDGGASTDSEDGAPDLLWELPPPGAELADEHTDRFLATSHTEQDLQKRLFHIDNKARTLVEDAGYNALHLAVGFLRWREEPGAQEARRAPLVLVPVQLERAGAQARFKLQWTGQDLDTNLSLKLRLEDHGIELPGFEMPEEAEGVYRYLEQVRERVEGREGWEVVPEVALGFFRFRNLSMYKDLDPAEWPEGDKPHQDELVRTILDPTEADEAPGPVDVDVGDLAPGDTNHVLDADPSQAAVIEAVKRGEDLVVEGPPGTGKSQTIVNLVAELVAQDKTVLFVSEKKAALDVVHGKLDAVGLADFCLELHSHKASKGDVLAELQRVAFQEPVEEGVDDEVYRELAEAKAALDGYAAALREPVDGTGRSPFELVCRRQAASEHFEEQGEDLPIVRLPDAGVDEEDLHEAYARLDDLVEAVEPVWPVAEHPWRGTDPGTVLPRKRRRVEAALEDAREASRAAQQRLAALGEAADVDPPATPRQAATLARALSRLLEDPPVDPELVLHEAWSDPEGRPANLVAAVEEHRELAREVEDRFRPRALEVDLAPLREAYRATSGSPLRWLRPSYWDARARVHDLYEVDPPGARATLLEDLQDLARYRELTAALEAARDEGRALFGRAWAGPGTDPSTLEALADRVQDVRAALQEGVLARGSLAAASPEGDPGALEAAIREARGALQTHRAAVETLLDRVGADAGALWGASPADVPVEDVLERVRAMAETVGAMDDWTTYLQARQAARSTAAAPVAEALAAGRVEPGDARACFTGNLADTLLEDAFETRDALAGFSGDLHERRVQRFREMDERAIAENRRRVRREAWAHRPHLVRGASSSSEAGVLVREFRKKQRHLPLRTLMAEAGSLVQDLKPCFMMSPLSVAKYLDPQKVRFDVVIFDEASQVRPQDALGAILRGDQLVVMGDPNQLPPTSFFEAVVDRDDGDATVGSIADLESILDACEGTLPRRSLRWHYRSRHESLIAVSNSAFYDDRLVIYPSPYQGDAALGLDLEHRPDTAYDRGGSRTNRGEARAVAEAALEHFHQHPDQSLGIGAFSSAQEQAIREEVELIRKRNPEMDPYFSEDEDASPFGHEHFMIKNLETIQGDERDVVFVSVGYGFDEEGRLTRNFGPLNHDGGWRRLNVLLTRARNRCVVFSNFTADDLELDEDAPRGVEGLARFLAYAEDGEAEGVEPSTQPPASTLDRAVKRFLEDEGYAVRANVGSAGFRVDLAVVDPEDPERYLLGVELDGPGYTDARVARERDRLRRDVLEERGWVLHHVWAADWYRSPETAKRRLLDALEDAHEQAPDQAPVETRAWEPAVEAAEPGEAEPEPAVQAPDVDEGLVDLAELAAPYERAVDPPVPVHDEDALEERPPAFVANLAEAVERVVEVEGPVHRDLVATRVRDAWELDRAGPRLKQAVQAGVDRATSLGRIELREGFLWAGGLGEVAPRRRGDGPAADIRLIPDEEVRAAVDVVLEHQRSTPPGEVASKVAALLGFDRKGKRIEKRVHGALERGRAEGAYERLDDGRVRRTEAPSTPA